MMIDEKSMFANPAIGRGPVLLASALLVALSLLSCSPTFGLRIESERSDLKQAVSELADTYRGQGRAAISVSDLGPGPGHTVVTVAWRLSPARADAAPLVNDTAPLSSRGVTSALALQRWARTAGGWTELPLLWDAWGLWGEAADVAAAAPAGSFAWADRGALGAKSLTLVAGGGDVGNAQALYWLDAAPAAGDPSRFALNRTQWGAAPARNSFGAFAAAFGDRVLYPASQHFGRADQENLAKQAGRRVYLLPFSAQYRWTWGGGKGFAPIAAGPPAARRIVVSVLAGRIEGGGRRDRRAAAAFLLWLLDPARQRLLEERTGLLPVNFNAPNLNGETKALRDAALACEAIDPVVPEPSDSEATRWASLLSSIVSSPGSWESHLTESSR